MQSKSFKDWTFEEVEDTFELQKVENFPTLEYKKEKGYASDPLGQLLMAMLAAQARNESGNQPIYGIYVIGRFWFFVVLEGKKYAVSLAYGITREAIFEVVGFLKGVKGYIEAVIRKK